MRSSVVSRTYHRSNPQGKKTLILKTKNEKGETVTSRKGIANVFGDFHSKLHDQERDDNVEYDHCRDEKNKSLRRQVNEDKINEILEFSKMRCRLQSTTWKKGKASDCNGVRVEDIEACSEKTKEMTRQIFNEILKQEDCTPTTLRRIRIKVIHKKGRCGRGRKLHANMHSASALQALFDVFVQ